MRKHARILRMTLVQGIAEREWVRQVERDARIRVHDVFKTIWGIRYENLQTQA